MEMKSIYQHPQALVLGVMSSEIQAELKILRQADLEIEDWRFQFAIIGESHRVRIEKAGQLVLQEILACVPLQSERCLHYHPCLEDQPHTFCWEQYAVSLYFEPQRTWEAGENQLVVNFPAVHGQIPVTCLKWEVQNETVYWWTLHTYPQPERLICVRTFSKFIKGN